MARPGAARRGAAGQGLSEAWIMEWLGSAWRGWAGLGVSEAWNVERLGMVWPGWACPGGAWHGKDGGEVNSSIFSKS